jgi:hypothetical protein
MTQFGYTMMCEQSPPDQLVADLQLAERAGFDFSVISDHYQPWLAQQGPSGYTWSILGAAAQATEQIGLMTYVTCPTLRYHPAVVAQKAATMQILSAGRFRLGLGAGENLNEHIAGHGWPAVGARHEMLREAIVIIRGLLEGSVAVSPLGPSRSPPTNSRSAASALCDRRSRSPRRRAQPSRVVRDGRRLSDVLCSTGFRGVASISVGQRGASGWPRVSKVHGSGRRGWGAEPRHISRSRFRGCYVRIVPSELVAGGNWSREVPAHRHDCDR